MNWIKSFLARSNCHIRAWEKFRSEEAEFMCVRFTKYSKVTWTQTWWWTPFRALGIVIQWLTWPLTHFGEMLRTGRWYHATWIKWDDTHMEYIPVGIKIQRMFPPVLFHGIERRVKDKHD